MFKSGYGNKIEPSYWTFKEFAIFVHNGINSVVDYNSLRVGVGYWMYVCIYGWMSPGKFHDGITFKRLEVLS